ncbi:hypothetical protein Tco_0439010 [Tanacetum coccineum]
MNENKNLFVPASMGYDQEMVQKTKDWVKRLNPDSKLLNFNTGKILVPESQALNESFETSNTPESSKDSEAEFLTPLLPLKILQGASPSSEDSSKESVSGTVHPKEAITTKSGELFKKAQDAKHENKPHHKSQEGNVKTWNLSLKQESLDWNEIELSLKMSPFQRWSDIDKVGMEAIVSYQVVASMVKSPENARFNMKLRKLIAEHPNQEKLKSKKVKPGSSLIQYRLSTYISPSSYLVKSTYPEEGIRQDQCQELNLERAFVTYLE